MNNIVEAKNIQIPNLNIESFGVCYKPAGWNQEDKYVKYFIPSLTFSIDGSWFKKRYTKTVYMPILFEKDTELKKILAQYDNLYFIISLKAAYSTHYSSIYHISNFVDIIELLEKERKTTDLLDSKFGISFIIKCYNQYDVAIATSTNPLFSGVEYNPFSSDDFVNHIIYKNEDTQNILKFIQDNYLGIPVFSKYYVKNPTDGRLFNHTEFDKMLKYINDLEKEDIERNKKLDSMMSKKTFKLVEN